MYSISSTANGLLRYLAVSSWIEARVSGVPGIGVKGTWGFDKGGGAAVLCGEMLTANVFNASWAKKKRKGKKVNSGSTNEKLEIPQNN